MIIITKGTRGREKVTLKKVTDHTSWSKGASSVICWLGHAVHWWMSVSFSRSQECIGKMPSPGGNNDYDDTNADVPCQEQ